MNILHSLVIYFISGKPKFPEIPKIKDYLGLAGEEGDQGRGKLLAQVCDKVSVLAHHLHVLHQHLQHTVIPGLHKLKT